MTRAVRQRWLVLSVVAGLLAGCGDEGSGPHRPDATKGGSSREEPETSDDPRDGSDSPGDKSDLDGSSDGPLGIDLGGQPKYFRLIRVTNEQWAASVAQLLKLSAPSGLEASFQSPVSGTTDFSNNEHLLEVNARGWQDYRDAAEQISEQATASSAALSALYAGSDAKGFVETFGRRVYRRPLTQAERTAYGDLFAKGSAMSGPKSPFAKGVALVLRAMLQSPHFLYRSELTRAGAPLSGYEVAAKLSLWLRGSTPDDALLDVADTLTTPQAVASQAAAMLAEPSAVTVMRAFQRELLHFDRFTQISKVNVPAYDEALNAELEETSYLFFDNIFSRGLGVRDIFTSTKGFVGPQMAKLYGLSKGSGQLVERELGPSRAGYFTQLPYLTLHGLNAMPDSIHRGVSLNLDVLCAKLGPPATVIPPLPPLKPGQTNRERVSTLTSGCGMACHNEMINPLGFALEHFDGMGQFRDEENGGLAIDSSGSYAFSSGRKTFKDAAELMAMLSTEQQAHLCYAKKLASFGLQRDIVAADLPWLNKLVETSLSKGGSVKEVMVELARSDAFRAHLTGAP